MVLSRRDFVRGSLCAVSAGLALGLTGHAMAQSRSKTRRMPSAGHSIPIEAQGEPLFFMTQRTFSQYIETRFLIDPGYTSPIETILIEVKDMSSAVARRKNVAGQECFLLTFLNDDTRTLKQGTYQVRHDALGTFELFVVPTEDKEGRRFFEAVINREVG